MRKVGVIIALLLLSCFIACQNKVSQTDERGQEELPALGHILNGSVASSVKIEVFSDFECSGCREFFLKTIQPILKEYPDKVCIVYYEFPLSYHQYSRQAARYIAAAYKLGRRQALSVYEAIFNEQGYWAADGSLDTSVSKALSSEDFIKVEEILRNPNALAGINETIEKELQMGLRKGINSTPTIFVTYDGKEQKVEGVPTYQVMKQFLDRLVK